MEINLLSIQDLVKLVGMNKPFVFNAPRGEVIIIITGEKMINAHKYYEFTTVVEQGSLDRVISAWYWELDNLKDFKLIDWFE